MLVHRRVIASIASRSVRGQASMLCADDLLPAVEVDLRSRQLSSNENAAHL
eukprot:CAMPEP_0174323644 /NCGR_PEP_ID=MMETSP0810-20121108/11955_1 /TAXON_ID=73025 ORGANISM="Eutreptiella gymnastica-like, Strain CCMP1594" /NCGR_SAMPLE_ID=MMETSP0810 /ASSEMBLY_ACC=CAM_ASM_000659 /LENGTH=50 /DNA_ID=CAMNT_0015436161 /DNA_START=360 /DNA_END=512 /DNA_ORIENTATION=+